MNALRPHQYQRDTLSAHAESLSKLSGRMVRGAEVLELGPAAGYFTRILKTALDCTVDAIEIDAEMAEKARPHCREIIVADLDALDWRTAFVGRRYDTIIAADVLEHLRSPERALRALVSRLKPGGKLLISLPNIAYSGMIFGLLEDDFRYRAEGLLDRTHLKFFTRTTLEEMLGQSGWAVTWRGEVRKDVYEAEFHTRVEQWPPALREFILEHPARAAYQLLCECVPESAPKDHIADETGEIVPSAQFSARLMWADSPESFSFEQGAVAFGEIGRARQTLAWQTPAPSHVLRIRLADRAGFMRLHALRVCRPNASAETIPIDLCQLSDDVMASGNLLTLGGAESWLQLPASGVIPAGTRVEFECGWPMSAEYEKTARAITEIQQSQQSAMAKLERDREHYQTQVLAREKLITERDDQLANTNAHVLHLESLAQGRAALVAERDQLITTLQTEKSAIAEARDAFAAERDALSQRVDALTMTQNALHHRIAQLRSFREWFAHRFKS